MTVEIKTFIRGKLSFVTPQSVDYTIKGRYLEGSISLVVGGVLLLDPEYWDDVSMIWHDLVEAVASMRLGKNYTFTYPDQPIDIRFVLANNKVTIRVDIPSYSFIAKASADISMLEKSILREGISFCNIMLDKTVGLNHRALKHTLAKIVELA